MGDEQEALIGGFAAEIARLELEIANLNEKVKQLSGVEATVGLAIAICLSKNDAAFPGKMAAKLEEVLRAAREERPEQSDDFAPRLITRLIEDLRGIAGEQPKAALRTRTRKKIAKKPPAPQRRKR